MVHLMPEKLEENLLEARTKCHNVSSASSYVIYFMECISCILF